MTCSIKQKARAKNSLKIPQSQQLRAWSAHLTCFPNDVFESRKSQFLSATVLKC